MLIVTLPHPTPRMSPPMISASKGRARTTALVSGMSLLTNGSTVLRTWGMAMVISPSAVSVLGKPGNTVAERVEARPKPGSSSAGWKRKLPGSRRRGK